MFYVGHSLGKSRSYIDNVHGKEQIAFGFPGVINPGGMVSLLAGYRDGWKHVKSL